MIGFREFLAIVLMLIGLGLIGRMLLFAADRQIIEAGLCSFAAVMVFRSGVGLFRMATAARIALKLRDVDRI